MTNVAITETLQPAAPVEIIWEPKIFLPFHPNGMKFVSLDSEGKETDQWTVFSVGGGALAEENDGASSVNTPDVYEMNSMTEILQWCERTRKKLLGVRQGMRGKRHLGLPAGGMENHAGCRKTGIWIVKESCLAL